MTPAKARARSSLLLTLGLLALVLHSVLGTVSGVEFASGFLLGLGVVCLVAGLLLTPRGRRREG